MFTDDGMENALSRCVIIIMCSTRCSDSQSTQIHFSDLSSDRQDTTIDPEHLR